MAAHSPILNTCHNLLDTSRIRTQALYEALKTKLRKDLYSIRNTKASGASRGSILVLLGLKESKHKPSRA